VPLPYREARAQVIATVASLVRPAREEVPLDDAAGRRLAVDVLADRDQPPFHRSTRDGFAVRAADSRVSAPLRVIGEIAAGRGLDRPVGAGEAAEIMTGAPLPDGADAVVMIENTTATAGGVRIDRPVAPGENVVAAGSELRAGALAAPRGALVGTGEIALLASLGCARVPVTRRPRVMVLATGDELVDAGATPGRYQIRNSNGPMLAAQVRRAGGEPILLPPARDDAAALRPLVARALAEGDLAVFSGGVSMGKYDLVEATVAELGARIVWDGAAIRPGKPVVFGTAGDKPFFGLPGNPLSALVTFELFARPAVELAAGAPDAPLRLPSAPLAAPLDRAPLPLTFFTPVRIDDAGLVPLPSQGSGDLASLARADGFAVTDPRVSHVPAGTVLPYLPR
jgi:molybdopterin molybdotransferase